MIRCVASELARSIAIVLMLLPAAGRANAAWVGLCPNAEVPPPAAKTLGEYFDPAGARRVLVAADEELPGCVARAVPVEARRIRWGGLNPKLVGGIGEVVILQGTVTAKGLAISEIITSESTDSPANPVAPADAVARRDAVPARHGTLPTARRPPPGRALWAWRPLQWQQDGPGLIARLRALHADTVYISVPVGEEPKQVAQREALGDFIVKARQSSIAVWAVDGDPRAVLPRERGAFLARAHAYADYNRGAAAHRRLRGIQYDIEPYLLPGYALDPSGFAGAYLETVALLRAESNMPLELAVPYWWASQRVGGAPLLDRLATLADGLAVMDYRTRPELIRAAARPFLEWAARYQRRVRIALDAGPVEDESRWHFSRAAAGELWQFDLAEHGLLLLFDAPLANPDGASFAAFRTSHFSGNEVTFGRDTRAFFSLIPQLEKEWSASPDFSGIALHGMLP